MILKTVRIQALMCQAQPDLLLLLASVQDACPLFH